MLLVQHEGESQEDLFERIKARLDRLRRDRAKLERVVLVAGSRWDGPSLLSRAQMLRKLLSRFSKDHESTQLMLDAGPKDGPGTLGMRAIAEALSECVTDTPLHLRVVSGPTSLPRAAA